jgi:hypothetical protein
VSDYGHPDDPTGRRPPDGQPPSPYDALGPAHDDDDAMAALARLQDMAPGPAPAAAAAATDATREAAPSPAALAPRPARRPKPTRRRRRGSMVARIAAPAVFLVAVVVLVALVYQSGIIGGTSTTAGVTPTPVATKTKSGHATKVTYKKYKVKSGDTLSAIADKYGTTVDEILALNPNMSSSTLVVGTTIKVPKPSATP